MEFKGTKGKWEVSNKKTYGRQMVDLGEFKGSIDIWYHNGDSMTKEEAFFNAKLISCAPEMLEALIKMCEFHEKNASYDKGDNGYYKAKQLIKKATE
jgi:hypothetical protein